MTTRQIEFILKLLDMIELGIGKSQNRPHIWEMCKSFELTKEDITAIRKYLYSIL